MAYVEKLRNEIWLLIEQSFAAMQAQIFEAREKGEAIDRMAGRSCRPILSAMTLQILRASV